MTSHHSTESVVMRVSVAEAKSRFSELIVRAGSGEEISVTRYGKPVARLLGAKADDTPELQRSKVQEAFRRIAQVRKRTTPGGDIKVIARDGLD